jgi:hypothetical protein
MPTASANGRGGETAKEWFDWLPLRFGELEIETAKR